jgi:adenylate cyclase
MNRLHLFLLCFFCSSAIAQPAWLLNKPFAEKWYYLDSLDKKFDNQGKDEAIKQLHNLETWAEEHNDNEFAGQCGLLRLRRIRRVRKFEVGDESKILELAATAHNNKNELMEADALQLSGEYYWESYQKHGSAIENYLAAYNIYKNFTPAQFPPKHDYIYALASAYFTYDDVENAKKFLKEVLETRQAYAGKDQYTVYNTIGLCYRKLQQYDSAEWYFRKVYDDATKNNAKPWIGIAGGNIGITYFHEKRYDEAIPLLKKDIEISLATTQIQNAAGSMAILGSIYYIKNELDSAEQTLQTALQICEGRPFWPKYGLAVQIFTQLYQVYAAKNEIRLAYLYADSALTAKDSLDNEHNALSLAKAQEKTDFVERKLEQEQLEIGRLALAKKRNEAIFFIASIVLMLGVIIFIVRNYKLLADEKKKSEDLLLNILPPEVANELKDKGVANARQFDDVTVLFTDFVNFTEASERMSPQQLVGELHACFKAFDDILGKYSIEKIKTVGDAYLAVSGLPVSNPNHATDVVAAALEIRDFMLHRREHMGNDTFNVRIGIHTGSVVAGIVGIKKFAYDIWGDTVNTAARMEQSSEPGKINISEATYELVKEKYTCVHRGKIEVKNKGVIDMYFVG